MTGLRKTAGVILDQEGVWFEYSPDGETIYRVKLKRAGGLNDGFTRLMEKLTRPLRRSGNDTSHIVPAKQREITAEVYAEHIVIDWDAVAFECDCNPDNIKKAFKDDNNFLEFCVQSANAAAFFRENARTTEAGN